MTIRVKDYLDTAFSSDDVKRITPVIDQAIAGGGSMVLDFSGITFFTTLFFSSAVTRFVFDVGPDEFDRMFHITGLTEVGQAAYNHSLAFAREDSQLTPEQREARLAAQINEYKED